LTEEYNQAMDETLGTVLRRLRHERGLTLEEVAEATGISVAMLSRAEREQRVPSTEIVAALSGYYGVPPEVLERYAADLHYRSRTNPRQGSRGSGSTGEPTLGRNEPPWYDSQHPPRAEARSVNFSAPQYGRRQLESPGVAASEPPATDALQDAARVAEVALETAMRAAERAKASGDPVQVAEAERVITRLRKLIVRQEVWRVVLFVLALASALLDPHHHGMRVNNPESSASPVFRLGSAFASSSPIVSTTSRM
jgi:transcriptional regulator with XRE-family HTH domain